MDEVRLNVDGIPVRALRGQSVAASVLNAGTARFRDSVTGAGRGPLCGMGICWECRVTVDGRPHVRACMEIVQDGMDVRTVGLARYDSPKGGPARRDCDVVDAQVAIVGAGPAGLAAACAAASNGVTTTVLDENPEPGGQIWRSHRGATHPRVVKLRAAAEASGARFIHAAVSHGSPGHLSGVRPDGTPLRVHARATVLATGAIEAWQPFPGWTRPGVFGAGGLQALVKGGMDIRGRRVLVAGSGPLLLAVAAYLRRRGAHLVGVAAGWRRGSERAMVPALLSRPSKLRQALSLMAGLRGVPRWYSAHPVSASGDDRVRTVTLRVDGADRVLDVDAVAYGSHLVPHNVLARCLGCRLDGSSVAVDDFQRSSVDGVLTAGETTGVGGVDLALVEGTIAGHAASRRTDLAERSFGRRRRERRFADAISRAFAAAGPPPDPTDDTVICRCEDVPWATLRPFEGPESSRDAKLATRCGMGPCQGRICGSINHAMLGWTHDRVRPPLQPTSVETLVRLGASMNEDE